MTVGWADRRSRAPYRGLVSAGLVLAGLHCSNPASLVIGIMALATADPEGPMTAMVRESFTIFSALDAPFLGSCVGSVVAPSSYTTSSS